MQQKPLFVIALRDFVLYRVRNEMYDMFKVPQDTDGKNRLHFTCLLNIARFKANARI